MVWPNKSSPRATFTLQALLFNSDFSLRSVAVNTAVMREVALTSHGHKSDTCNHVRPCKQQICSTLWQKMIKVAWISNNLISVSVLLWLVLYILKWPPAEICIVQKRARLRLLECKVTCFKICSITSFQDHDFDNGFVFLSSQAQFSNLCEASLNYCFPAPFWNTVMMPGVYWNCPKAINGTWKSSFKWC